MASSISISSPARYLAAAGAAAIVATASAQLYTRKADPELAFWESALAVKLDHARALNRHPGARVFFAGGSSCAFSIDPAVLLDEFGIQACNFGVIASAGVGLQLELPLQCLRKGDLLVLALESPLWASPSGAPSEALGSQLWYRCLKGKRFEESRLPDIGSLDVYSPTHMRPGGYHCATMLLKAIRGGQAYRYSEDDIKDSGLLVTDFQDDSIQPAAQLMATRLSEEKTELLRSLKAHLAARGVGLAVSLPWNFTREEIAVAQRASNQALAAQIGEICPVLEDPHFGVAVGREQFADTVWHLSATAATQRSRIVGASLGAILSHPSPVPAVPE